MQLDLSGAEGLVRVNEDILENVAVSADDLSHLPDKQLYEDVGSGLAELYDCDTANIVLGNGSDELIDNIARLMYQNGASSVTLVPTFEKLYGTNVKSGYASIALGLNEEEGFTYTQSVHDNVINTIKKHEPKVVWLCSPNNPTGTLIDKSYIAAISDVLTNGVVVIDQAFADIVTGGLDSELVDVAVTRDNVVIVNSFSKSWGLSGLRVGFAITHPDLAIQINELSPLYNLNILALKAANETMRSQSYRLESIKLIKRHVQLLQEKIVGCKNISAISNSETGLFMLKHRTGDMYDLFLDKGIKSKRIHIFPPYDYSDYCRIKIPIEADELDVLIDVIDSIEYNY